MADVVKKKPPFLEQVVTFAHRKFDQLAMRGASRKETYALHVAVIADIGVIAAKLHQRGESELVTRLALNQAVLTAIASVTILTEPAYGTAALPDALKEAFDVATEHFQSVPKPTQQ